MSSRPPVKLSLLRDIGWSAWDPIGLKGIEGGWEGSAAADEYDTYLLHVTRSLQRGEPDNVLVDYLVVIETGHMGLSPTPTARARAEATVAAVREYVESIN
jgi:hypothetical protein